MFSVSRKSDRHAIGPLVYLFAVFSAVVTVEYLDMFSGEQTGHMLCPLPETGGMAHETPLMRQRLSIGPLRRP